MRALTGLPASKFILLALGLLQAPWRPATAEVMLDGATMGSTWTVRIAALPAGQDAGTVRAAIEGVLESINRQMSTYRETSEITRFNRTPGLDWFPVSPDFAAVVAESARISALTGGAFDITVAPLVDLWGFGPDWSARQVPAAAAVEATRARVGWQGIEARMDPPALRRTVDGITLDVSAIAVGYAVDRLADVLEDAGVEDYLIDVGGEFRGRGSSAAGRPWRVGVEHPGTGAVAAAVELQGMALATSGDYRNYYEAGGEFYSHVLDPRTGRPVSHQLASVTVVTRTATEADALATAFLVLGLAPGRALADEHALAVLWVVRGDSGYRVVETPAFARLHAEE